jgi:2,5-diamino-6-(5-phosphoribosylamino)pyrimidin-4(3H)-one reductase (EC 1.1.1.-)
MVGVGTVLADDPHLTLDVADRRVQRQRHGRPGNPARVVADSMARTPPDARILDDEAATYIVVAEDAPEERRTALAEAGAELIVAGDERVDIATAVDRLADEDIDRLMIEGGGELIYSAFAAAVVDELSVFVGSKIIGGRDAPTLADGEGFVDEFPALTLDDVERSDDGVVLHYTVTD